MQPRPPTVVSDPTGKLNPIPTRPYVPRRGTTWRLGEIKVTMRTLQMPIFNLDPDPWILIFLRIRIQEAKMLRILSNGYHGQDS